MRAILSALATLCLGALLGCSQATTATQADAATSTTDVVLADADGAATDTGPDTKTVSQCSATCSNGVCESGEAPGSCSDCTGYGNTCIETACAAELATCNAKPGCAQMVTQCLHPCGDTPACALACQHMGSAGVSAAYAPLVACIAAKGCSTCGDGTCDAGENSGTCPADCKAASAGNGLCEPGESLTCTFDCGAGDYFACLASECPEVVATCNADPVCAPALQCYRACNTMGCFDACAAKWGSATMALLKCEKPACQTKMRDVCGNGYCDGDELWSCPKDCQFPVPVCGNGSCEPGESSKTCAGDCGAPTDVATCVAEHCATQQAACKADAGCAAVIACLDACPVTSEWKACAKSCSPVGASLWLSLPYVMCIDGYGCRPVLPPYCGDGTCQAGETAAACPSDCYEPSPVCGDGWCAKSETVAGCPQDCATCETTGCQPDKGGEAMVCCKVSGMPICAYESACD